jgi:putative ABC transport system permease protein
MNDGTLVQKNLWRKTLRTILLVFSIFIAFLLFGVLGAVNYQFKYAPNPEGANRLMTMNKINFTQPLPFAYLDRIRRVEGVQVASFQNWFGGYYQDPQNLIQTFGIEPESWARVYSNSFEMSDDQWQAFFADRTGIIISRPFAERNGLRLGQRIPLMSNIYTNGRTGQQSWDFTIRGIFDAGNGNPNSAFFNYEYFRESATFGTDNIGMIVFLSESAAQNDAVAQRIDAMFANSPAETSTQDELAFGRAFLAQYGDITFIITLVIGAAFAAILLIVGNTMVMAVRERTKEIGVLKTLGFSSPRIMRMVLSESLRLSLTGAVLGLLLALAATLALKIITFDSPGLLVISGMGIALALVFGLVTGFAPALSALNLKIVDALGRK